MGADWRGAFAQKGDGGFDYWLAVTTNDQIFKAMGTEGEQGVFEAGGESGVSLILCKRLAG